MSPCAHYTAARSSYGKHTAAIVSGDFDAAESRRMLATKSLEATRGPPASPRTVVIDGHGSKSPRSNVSSVRF